METGKNVAASAKETVGNIAASAKAAIEKTKATVQEKVEKATSHDQVEKDMAREKKEGKIAEAESNKQEARELNAAAQEQARTGYQASGLATAEPHGHVISGVAESHPIRISTGTGRTTAAQNPLSGSTTDKTS